MIKIKVLSIFVLLALVNIFVINVHNLPYLFLVFMLIYLLSLKLSLPAEIFRRIKLFLAIGLSIVIFELVFNHNSRIVERFLLGIRVSLQITTISESVFLAMKILSLREIVKAVDFLPKSFQILLSMTFYFIPLLVREYNSIQLVQQSRGLGSNFLSRLFFPIYVLVPLLHQTFRRSQTITLTILSRGFEI